MSDLFSDREPGRHRARTCTEIDQTTWRGIIALMYARRDDGSFGYGFPDPCPDPERTDPIGTNFQSFREYIGAHIEGFDSALSAPAPPPTPEVLDLLELLAKSIGHPIERGYHAYWQHRHLGFDREAGLRRFVEDVNRLLDRGGIGFEMDVSGRMRRLGPPLMRDAIAGAVFRTGDGHTDQLLTIATDRILSTKPQDRIDALEKLWDAFERVKTLEPGSDKKAQMKSMLDKASSGTGPKFREVLETEALALTAIGNDFRIRHSETNREPLVQPEQIDTLFHRMFSFLRFLLSRTGRET